MSPRTKDALLKLPSQILAAARPRRPSPRVVCLECRFRNLYLRSAAPAPAPARSFSSTSTLSKKSSSSSKSARKSPEVTPPQKSEHIPDNAATRKRDAEIDPYDFTELNAGIAKAVARLKDGLIKTRDAGRITPEMVESLPVELNLKGAATHGARPHHERMKLGDIASVVQKGGRMLQVYCAEEAVCLLSLPPPKRGSLKLTSGA